MSDTRAEPWNFLLWPLLIATLIFTFPNKALLHSTNLSADFEITIVYILATVATLAHLHYAQSVVSLFLFKFVNIFFFKCI